MTGGDLIRILNRKPESRWPDGALHHGVRVIILLVIAVSASALFPVSPLPDTPPVEKGAILQEDVIAEVPFPVYKTDEELLEDQQEAAARVNPIFVYDSTAVDSTLALVDRLFAQIDSVAANGSDTPAVRRVRDLLSAYNIRASDAGLAMLLDPGDRSRLQGTLQDVIRAELDRGIVMETDLQEVSGQTIELQRGDQDQLIRSDSILTDGEFAASSRFHVPRDAPAGYADLQRLILRRLVVPSIQPDWPATDRARQEARLGVNPVKATIQQNQRVVPAREPITDADLERFRAYRQELIRRGQAEETRSGWRTLGAFLFNLITLSLFGALLFLYRQEVYRDLRHVLLIGLLVLALLIVAAVISTAEQEPIIALIPIAFPALVVATLWDGRLALNLSLILAVLLTGQPQFLSTKALVTLVSAGAVASLSMRVMRRRSQIWAFIGLIAGAYVLVNVVLGLMQGWTLQEISTDSGWGAVNAVASAFAAMGFLPVFEGFTRITTDQTLLELADANRPLLRRLSMEAPGTYAHSINVANLAEAAANGIGANALLTRVGVYYHDVGKIGRPHYFIENQPGGGRNPHDKLKPATSAQVVRNHVIDGLRLAEEEKLPDCVKAFILEHHGTQPISFFYDQAREADPNAALDPDDFAYPGPRPQSKETAIVMLADSVESAARVLPDPTPESIAELVDRIVRGKIDAAQLDETPLTLEELAVIKDNFANVLTGMYHRRIDYPPTRETAAGEEEAASGEGGSDREDPESVETGSPRVEAR